MEIIVAVIGILSLANGFPHEPTRHSEIFNCKPTVEWDVIASFSAVPCYGEIEKKYALIVGTTFESNTASQESETLYKMFADEFGKIYCSAY